MAQKQQVFLGATGDKNFLYKAFNHQMFSSLHQITVTIMTFHRFWKACDA